MVVALETPLHRELGGGGELGGGRGFWDVGNVLFLDLGAGVCWFVKIINLCVLLYVGMF